VARRPSEIPKEPNPDLIAIPVREGGLGIPLYKDLASSLFQAAREASEPVLEKIRSFSQLPSFSRDPSPRIGKTAQEVLRDTNRARLACFLETCPTSYKQARLENASYLGRKWLVSYLFEKTYLLQTLRSLRPSAAGSSTQLSQLAYLAATVVVFLPLVMRIPARVLIEGG
jgi:hypothetical protein